MKRLILIATAVLFSTLTLWGQVGGAATSPTQSVSTSAHRQRHRNKRHGHRHPAPHHSGINARR